MRRVLCLALCLLLLAGCLPHGSETGVPDGTPVETGTHPADVRPDDTTARAPTFALPYDPAAGLDPRTVTSAANAALLPLLYDALFETDAAFVTHPRLCLRAEPDATGTVWTLFLRDDVTFSDGTPLTPDVVRDCLNAYRRSDSAYSARLADVTDIRVGEGRVILTLRAPNGSLPALLDLPIFLPGDSPLGTGPYVQAGEVLLRRDDRWRGGLCPVAEIALYPITSADGLVAAFDAGQVALTAVLPTATAALSFSGDYEIRRYPTTSMLYLGFQTAQGVCADGAVRRALALAADREYIASALFASSAVAAELPIHPAAYSGGDLADALRYDPSAAAALLEDAGWSETAGGPRQKGRERLQLTLLVNNENPFRLAAAEHLAAALTALGAEVTVQSLGWDAYLRALTRGKFDLYLAECRLAPDFDLTVLLAPDGALNYGGYEAETLPELLSAARADPSERSALYQLIADDAPIAPLLFLDAALLTRWGRVSGAAPSMSNLFFGFERWRVD